MDWRRLRPADDVQGDVLMAASQGSRSASLRASAARSAEWRIVLPKRYSRNLVDMAQNAPGQLAAASRYRLWIEVEMPLIIATSFDVRLFWSTDKGMRKQRRQLENIPGRTRKPKR
jgi:hypothetical protein